MAWVEHDPKSDFYRIGFRYGGRKFNRSKGFKFRVEREAEAKKDEGAAAAGV